MKLLAAALLAATLLVAAKPAAPSAELRATAGTGCGTLLDEQHCTTLSVTLRNYTPDVASAYAEFVSRTRPNGVSMLTSESYFFTADGNRVLTYYAVVCDEARPWYAWRVLSPLALESNTVRACQP